MFKNLIFELEKKNIKIKDAASCLEIPASLLEKKLNGQIAFRLLECLKLQKLIGEKNICLDYLFEKNI